MVEFTEKNEVDVVPVRWLSENETMCLWPNYRMSAKISKAVKANIAPNAEFRPLPVRVLAKTSKFISVGGINDIVNMDVNLCIHVFRLIFWFMGYFSLCSGV